MKPPTMSATALLSCVLSATTGCATHATGPQAPHAMQGEVDVEGGGLPSAILDGHTGRAVDDAAFWSNVRSARVVCVGEEHPNAHHHWVQLQVVKKLVAGDGAHLGVGMEMFQRPFQGVLDDYAAGRIDEPALLARSGWAERWGYPFALYQPMVSAIRAAHGALIALNPSKELVKRVSHDGLEALTPEEQAQVPELDLHDATHRAWFDGIMDAMGGPSAHTEPKPAEAKPAEPAPALPPGHPTVSGTPLPPGHPAIGGPTSGGGAEAAPAMPSMERIYTVQVLWDETMADTAATWVKGDPSRHIVILAGNGHCHDSAIVARVKRRGVTDVVSVRPIIDDGDGDLAALLATPENDYVWVLTAPPEPTVAADAPVPAPTMR